MVHLHPLLHSKQWDARIAAVEALEAILKELPTPVKVKKEETDDVRDATEKPKDQTKSRLTFSTFSLSTCLANHGPLEGSQGRRHVTLSVKEPRLMAKTGNEYASSEVNEDTQRQALNKTLGLDMAAKLGIVTDEIFNSDDLKSMSSSKASPNNSNGKSMSAREKNKLKRSRSKIEKTKNLMQKRQKLLLAVYQGWYSSLLISTSKSLPGSLLQVVRVKMKLLGPWTNSVTCSSRTCSTLIGRLVTEQLPLSERSSVFNVSP